MSNVYNKVGGLHPRRTAFNLSNRMNFTADMGKLVPIFIQEAVPGDHFALGVEQVIRFQPLAAPIMHEITSTVRYFFVPDRIMWPQFERFISQGDYLDGSPLPIQLPRMDIGVVAPSVSQQLFSLWDYFGFPVRPAMPASTNTMTPIDFPWRAYNYVYHEYFRDQDLQPDTWYNDDGTVNQPAKDLYLRSNIVRNVAWRKDYFTAARPFRQKGQAPALPVNIAGSTLGFTPFTPDKYSDTFYRVRSLPPSPASGITVNSMQGPLILQSTGYGSTGAPSPGFRTAVGMDGPPSGANTPIAELGAQVQLSLGSPALSGDGYLSSSVNALGQALVPGLKVTDLDVSTFNVSDLRLSFQVQKWLERNARAGTRYTEFLQSHFGVSPTDARLDRPEYIGGCKMPVMISEVLQTSQTTDDSPLAQFGGHGLAADSQFCGKYNVQEFGVIIGVMSVVPKPSYQDGIDRQWLRRLPIDFYFPEYAHLSEQAIYQAEIYAGLGAPDMDDTAPFGFIGQYDEMRSNQDRVAGEMRLLSAQSPQLSYWNMTRKFSSPPLLNESFISTADVRKDIFAVGNVPGLIINVRNIVKAVRPLPAVAEPGLIDHF